MAVGRWVSSLPSPSPVQMVGEDGKQVPRVAKEECREEGVVGVVGK